MFESNVMKVQFNVVLAEIFLLLLTHSGFITIKEYMG